MPIEHGKGGTTITGESLDFYRLAAMRSAVGLEMKGIKVRRGPVVWKQAAREYGIRGNRAAVYAWLCAKVEELRPQQEHIHQDASGRTVRTVAGQEVQ
jgi:hypothetical protein